MARRVYLSPEVLAKYKQEEQEAQERYDVVNINEEPEDATEAYFIQEEANFEAQKVRRPQDLEEVPVEVIEVQEEEKGEEEKPIIVYPEGTIQQYDERPSSPQAPVQQSPVRRPPPPSQRRPRPPPPNFRRPPPQYLPALSRNAQDQRPPPPPRGDHRLLVVLPSVALLH